VYARASLTDILARIVASKSARVRQVGGQVGENRRACPARGKLNGEVARHADILATILARRQARMSVSVSVSVSVPWNSNLTITVCDMESSLLSPSLNISLAENIFTSLSDA